MAKWRFRSSRIRPSSRTKESKKKWSCFEWAQLVVALAIPVAITAYTIVQTNNENSIAEENRHQDVDLANKTRLNDLAIADNREKEIILNNYLDFLTKLIDKDGFEVASRSAARSILQFNTLTVFEQLDSKRKSHLIRCLYDNGLITHRTNDSAIIHLNSINLVKLNLNTHPWIQSTQSTFTCVMIADTVLAGSSFRHVDLSGTYFHRAFMDEVDLTATKASVTDCEGGQTRTVFFRAVLAKASFNQASYADVNFMSVSMNNSHLREFICVRCNFTEASLVECDMSYAKFNLATNQVILLGGGSRSSTFINADLSFSVLFEATFERTLFTQANLTRINGTRAHFIQCDFANVTLTDCIFRESQFNGSSFINADLTNCKMNRIKMTKIDFSGASLVNVDFTDAECHQCIFNDANLTGINFTNTSLDGSYFKNTLVTDRQLIRARSLVDIHLTDRTQFMIT